MSPNPLTFARIIPMFFRLKLLNLTSRFPPLTGGVLDEQMRLVRGALETLGEKPVDQGTAETARRNFRNGVWLLKKVGAIFERVDSVRDLSIPGPASPIPARLYLPSRTGVPPVFAARTVPGKDKIYPLFVLFHGGGWTTGDLNTVDNLARFLCKRGGFAVLSVDYRLAPEHIFPAAVEDAFAATEWAVEHAEELGADPQRVLVGGDSAGGTLSTVVTQMSRGKGAPRLAGQVLFYPATNAANLDTPSFKEFGEKSLGLPRQDIEWYLDQYTPDPKDRLDPRVSPLLADDLQGLPPALVVTAEFDVLRDEAEDYAHRLEEAGVPVKLMRCNGMIHGFLSMAGLIQRATRYFEQVVEEIRGMAGRLLD